MNKVTANKDSNRKDQLTHLFFTHKDTPVKRDDIVGYVAEKIGMTKVSAKEAMDAIIGAIVGSIVAGNKVRIQDLGTFETKSRKAGTARNPKTGQPIKVPEMTIASFRPSKTLRTELRSK